MDKEKALFESLLAEREEYADTLAELRRLLPELNAARAAAEEDPDRRPELAALIERVRGEIKCAMNTSTLFRQNYINLIELLAAAKNEVTNNGFLPVVLHAAEDAQRTLTRHA